MVGHKISLIGILLSVAMGQLYASEEQLTVKLNHLINDQQHERDGDELYISVTEFTAGKQATHYQIPSYPAHWLSRYLVNVKDVTLWQQPFNQCSNADLIISLVEQDFAPWNMDDLLGSVRLKIRCDQGKMTTQWDIPNTKITAPIRGKPNTFSFMGNHAIYRAEFSVSTSKSASKVTIPSPKSAKEEALEQRSLLP